MAEQDYSWLRQEGEGVKPYEAFRVYLELGLGRTLGKVEEKVGKSHQMISLWSAKWNWVERCRDFDTHVSLGRTDLFEDRVAIARDENMDLVRKLRGHLSKRLDTFIERDVDPPVRWTQALIAMAKLEQNSFMIKDDSKTSMELDALERKVAEALGLDA